MLSVRSGTLEIAYRTTGEGDPIVFINGTGESSYTWVPTMDAFADRYRCVAVDLRDTGASGLAEAPYAPSDLASDVGTVIDELGLGACHMVGFSLGGAVAQELALARPDSVRSIVLLSTWARTDPWFASQIGSWKVLRRALGDDVHGFDVALEAWMFSPVTMDDPALLKRIHEAWDAAPEQDAEAFCRQCDADIAHDAAGRLAGCEVPALVVVGEDDICTPPRYSRELCELLPQASMVTIPEAGHCAVFEQPKQVRAAIADFLASF